MTSRVGLWKNAAAMGISALAFAGCNPESSIKPLETADCEPLAEIPYDGIDQDCDGADLIDVDGDGFDATAAGGDDCDDGRAEVYPGTEDVLGDGLDNDCNGHVDEVRACADGSGDFLSIQAAVDATPDGGTVEICPGRWTEHVVVADRSLMLAGVGAMPEDTVLDASDGGPVVMVTGDDAEVTIDWLSLQGDDLDDQLVGFADDPSVVLSRLDISDRGEATAGTFVFQGGCNGDGSLTVTHSRIRGELWLAARCLRIVSFVGNTLDGATTIWVGLGSQIAEFRNNVIIGDSVTIWGEYARTATIESAHPVQITNNTFVQTTIAFRLYQDLGLGFDATTPVEIENNIFNGVFFGGEKWGAAYTADVITRSPPLGRLCDSVDPQDVLPSLQADLYWASTVPDPPGSIGCSSLSDSWVDTAAFEEAFWRSYYEADPMFEYAADRGSYALSPGSPAVDAGVGDADPDGSPPDIGAFGGPDGDWFQEYPWPLD